MDMHDTLLGDIRGLLCLLLAKTNILEYVREQDFSVYVKLSAVTGSQQTYKKMLDYACCCASQLCITTQHNFVPDADFQTYAYCKALHVFHFTGDCECSYCTFAYRTLELHRFIPNLEHLTETH